MTMWIMIHLLSATSHHPSIWLNYTIIQPMPATIARSFKTAAIHSVNGTSDFSTELFTCPSSVSLDPKVVLANSRSFTARRSQSDPSSHLSLEPIVSFMLTSHNTRSKSPIFENRSRHQGIIAPDSKPRWR